MAPLTYPGPVREGLAARRTRQREAIMEVLKEATGPIDAGELLLRSRARLPGLGLATVYRTLRPLLDDRCIVPVSLPDGSTAYELGGRRPHAHFLCTSCGRLFDVEAGPPCLPPGTVLPGGLVVDGWSLMFHGLCRSCRASGS